MKFKQGSVKAKIVEQYGDGSYATRNHELERKVLKTVFRKFDQIAFISAVLSEDHFSDPRYRELYIKCVELYEQGRRCDPSVVLAECLRKPNEDIDPDDFKQAVGEIQTEHVDDLDLDVAIRTLNNLLLIRKMMAFNHEVIERAANGEAIESLISDASERIKAMSQNSLEDDDMWNMDRIVANQPEGPMSIIRPTHKVIRTPFASLNDVIYGFRLQDITVVGARPGVGKTALLCQCASYTASLGKKTLFYAHEMSKESMLMRLMCMNNGISNSDVNLNMLTDNEVQTCLQWFSHNPSLETLRISDKGGRTPLAVRADIIRHNDKYGPLEILYIDYLQRMSAGKTFFKKNDEIGYISSSLKDLASEFNIPIVYASSMNREVEKRQGKEKRPQLSDLAESGQVESDASVVIFPYRPSMINPNPNATPEDDELIIGKHRHGATGIVKVKYNGPYFRFDESTD